MIRPWYGIVSGDDSAALFDYDLQYGIFAKASRVVPVAVKNFKKVISTYQLEQISVDG
jgi:hypothetical protein